MIKFPMRMTVIAPHPDDEVIGAGGTLALHARQGDRVHVLVAFDGAAALPGVEGVVRLEVGKSVGLMG